MNLFMKIFFILYLATLSLSEVINNDFLSDDPLLESYFVSYVNGTKVITKLSDINKKFLK